MGYIILMQDTPALRVAGGAELLDKEVPGWFDIVDPDRLDMNHFKHCVLGQLFGDINKAPFLAGLRGVEFIRECQALGFYPDVSPDRPHEAFVAEYIELVAQWRHAIEARREVAE